MRQIVNRQKVKSAEFSSDCSSCTELSSKTTLEEHLIKIIDLNTPSLASKEKIKIEEMALSEVDAPPYGAKTLKRTVTGAQVKRRFRAVLHTRKLL